MSHKFKTNLFSEQTLLSTPNPICSSSMTEKNTRNISNTFDSFDIDDMPQRLSEANSSLGILSVTDKLLSPRTSFNINSTLKEQRSLAFNTIERANQQIAQVPTHLLKPSTDITGDTSFNTKYISTQSTISDSDLLLQSTPRHCSTLNVDQFKGRHSISHSLARLSQISKSSDMNALIKNFNDFINPDTVDGAFDSEIFKPGEEAENDLLAGEISWKRDKNIPAEIKEITINSSSADKNISMGAFFRKRSEDCSNLVSESFKNLETPLALFEEGLATELSNAKSEILSPNILKEQSDTLSVTGIQRILSETKNTPGKALELLLDANKKKSKTPKKKSLNEHEFLKPRGIPPKSKSTIKNALNHHNDELKENIEFQDKSRSSSALSNLPDGKLPIETTKSELIWGCIKIGKSANQEFMIRNKSRSRLQFYLNLQNPAFKVIFERSELDNNNMRLTLHPYELKKITIIFAPTKIGAAVSNLYFNAHNSERQTSKQFIRLFGYGGAANVAINAITRDATGKFLLSLGTLQCSETVKKSFVLKNEGALPVFATLSYMSPGFYQFTSINVTPNKVVILPNQQAEIHVAYYPKKEDYEHLKSKIAFAIADLGKLNLLYGSEIDRGRLRRICNKLSSKGLEIPQSAIDLIKTFPGEAMPLDLRDFKEASGSLKEILKLFNTKEISLYFEHDVENTLVPNFPEESDIFQSLCENETRIAGATFCSDRCSVEPSVIVLTPPSKNSDVIVISNNGKKTVCFEVGCKSEGLQIKPSSGVIKPDEVLTVGIMCDFEIYKNKQKAAFVVRILLDDEAYEVNIKVLTLTKD